MAAVQNPEIRKAVDTLYEISADEKVRAEYEMRQKAWRDRISQLDGYYQDGRQKGRLEGLQETARNLKAMGFSDDQIRKATGLAEDE